MLHVQLHGLVLISVHIENTASTNMNVARWPTVQIDTWARDTAEALATTRTTPARRAQGVPVVASAAVGMDCHGVCSGLFRPPRTPPERWCRMF